MPIETRARVKEIIQRTYNVKSIRLEPESLIDFKAGQFLCIWLKDSNEYKRYLSISNSPTEIGYVEVTKKITQSLFSQNYDQLKVGDIVKIQYPMGKFTLDVAGSKICFISGGIGITPIRSICKYAADKKLNVDMQLLYANRSQADVAFKEDFDAIEKEFPGFKVTHVLCEASPEFVCVKGLINCDIVKGQVCDYMNRKFLLCGPPPMVEAMKKMLRDELLVPQENIITENFQGY